jgi:hypothetical protein
VKRLLAAPALLLAAVLALAFGPSAAQAQKALVYCPVGIDDTGCQTVTAALAATHPGGVDRAYDGTNGTVDLKTADLFGYDVLVVPSLAEDSASRPYGLLRDTTVVRRLRAALLGRRALWSGTPDQGAALDTRPLKDRLIRNLAVWAGAGHATVNAPGLVVLQDQSDEVSARYAWLTPITGMRITADPALRSYASVRALTTAGIAVLTGGNGSALAYANMASFGFYLPTGAAGLSMDAVGQTGTSVGGQVVLVTSEGANTGGAVVSTDRDDYAPGDTVTITGSGYAPGETIKITLHEDPQVHADQTLTVKADADGKFVDRNWAPEEHHLDVRFVMTAVGQTSGRSAQTTFTDGRPNAPTLASQTPNPVINGSSATFQITVPFNGAGTCTASLSATPLAPAAGSPSWPTSASFTFTPLSVTVNGTGQAVTSLNVATPQGMIPGTYKFTVTATPGTGCPSNASAVTSAVADLVVAAPPTLTTVDPASGTSGSTTSLTATAAYVNGGNIPAGATINFALNGASVGSAAINGNSGRATLSSASLAGINAGTYPTGVTATLVANGGVWASSTASAELIVTSATVATTTGVVSSLNPAIVGQSVTYTATVTPASGTAKPAGTIQFKDGAVNLGAAQTLSAAATASITDNTLSVGPHSITAVYTPATGSTFTTSTSPAVAQVINNKITPTISWATPADITYGTALSSTQLNATATANGTAVAGTFTYTPASGAVLSAGSAQTLNATFTPTDAAVYTTATGSVRINVGQAPQAVAFTSTAPTAAVVGGTYAVSATGGASGNSVTFALDGLSKGCSLSGSTVTMTAATASAERCVVVALQAGNANFTAALPVSQSFSVGKAPANVTLASLAATYDGSPKAATATTTAPGTSSFAFAYTQNGADITSPTNAGEYDVVATLANANYTGTASGTLVIGKAPATITLTVPSAQRYTGSPISATATVEPAAAGVAVTYNGTSTAPTAVGSYAVVASVTNANYAAEQKSGTLGIGKGAPTIVWAQPAAITFGAALSGTQLAASTTVPGTFVYTPSLGTTLDAGTNTLSVSFTPTDAGSYESATASVQLTVNKAAQTVAFTSTPPATLAYDASYTPRATVSSGATAQLAVSGGACSLADGVVTITAGSGSCSVTASAPATTNYEAAIPVAQTIAAAKATATIALTIPTGLTYTGRAQGATASVTPAAAGEVTITYAGSTTAPTNAGSYPVRATIASANYAAEAQQGTLTIGKATPTITWATPTGIRYGTALSAEQLNATSSGDGALTYSPAAGTVPAAGPQELTVTAAATDNYATATKAVTLAVSKAALTVRALDKARSYGADNPTLDGTLSGVLAGDGITASYTTTATATSGIGTYAIEPQLADPNGKLANYEVAKTNGTLTVGKATLAIKAADATRSYGAANPAFTGSVVSGAQNGETFTVTATSAATPASGVGTYAIVPSVASGSTANYDVVAQNGTLTITKASQTIAFTAPSGLTYGDAPLTLAASATSQLPVSIGGSGACSVATGGAANLLSVMAAGSCTVTATQGGDDNYNAADPVTYTVAVSKAPLTVTVDAKSKVYGAANPTLTGAITGLKGSDVITATYSTSAEAGSAVGSYPITATLVDARNKLGNYVVTATEGALTVSKAALTVKVNDASRAYGQANPTFTAGYAGLVNGDGPRRSAAPSASRRPPPRRALSGRTT